MTNLKQTKESDHDDGARKERDVKLNPIIQIGWCKSYGDGDFAVSSVVSDYTREQINEMIVMTFWAMKCMVDMWQRNNQPQQAEDAQPHRG